MIAESAKQAGFLRRVRYALEYAAVRAAAGMVGVMPERVAVFAGKCAGLLYWLSPRRRRIARENMERAMPGELSEKEVRRAVKDAFVNIGLTAVEALWMQKRASPGNILDRFALEGAESAERALAGGRGLIVFACHVGNWELFGGCIGARLGRLNALARPVNNPLVWRYLASVRERMHITGLSTREGVRPMIAALRRGEALGVLMDQHVNRAFVATRFFGREAATTAVVASLALRFNTPVFFVYSLRDGQSFRHHGYFEGPVELVRTGDREADVRANTQMFSDRIEGVVRRHPGQWLWTHRRWKLAERGAGGATEGAQENTDDVGPID